MPHGVRTPPEKVEEFRARYLHEGNASKAARDMGMPASTGRVLAQEAERDPTFVAACRELRDNALAKVTRMVMSSAEHAHDRIANQPAPQPGIQDVTWQAGKFLTDAQKNLIHLSRLDSERGGEITAATEVRIFLKRADDGDDDDGDDGGDGGDGGDGAAAAA